MPEGGSSPPTDQVSQTDAPAVGSENNDTSSAEEKEEKPQGPSTDNDNDKGELAGYSNSVQVNQYGNSVQVFSAKLNQNFKFGIFNWENEIAYQKSSNEDILPLPALTAYSNIYLVFRIAKVLRVQLGADVRYFTEYYAPDYLWPF